MAAKKMVQVGEQFLSSLSGVSWSDEIFQGYLFGQVTTDKTIVVGFAKTSQSIKHTYDHTYVSQHLVGGLDICGVIVKPGLGEDPLSAAFAKLVKVLLAEKKFLTQNVLICLSNGEISSQSFYWLSELEDKINATQAEIEIRDHSILSESLLVRIQTKITMTCLNPNSIKDDIDQEVQRLCSDIKNGGSLTFSIAESSILLMYDATYGLKKNSTASSLLEYLPKLKSSQEVILSMEVLKRLSNNNIIPTCAPFIQHNIGEENCLMVDLPIDVLCFIPLDMPTKDINQLICQTIGRQIEAMGCNIRDNIIDNSKVFLPEAFHFQPPESDYYLSVIYPKNIADVNLESSRKKLHEVFCLPSNRPLLKRNNKCIFGGEDIPGGYLLNPHTHINIQPLKESKFYLVKGNYTYHHYMQDKFDDNQWGCAYRSLQTICSWFRFQGYTERPVPTHKEIQQALVDIGDKDEKFVGSRKWIGSLEVSYCLDNLLGITSKILSVSAGAELANKGRELAQHFSTQGTPVMIGGGVLAHTILGINFSEVTGDIRFLILDPHYTGGEYIREVIDKGWCGWKGPDFWDQSAMYNMCLPQIPSGSL